MKRLFPALFLLLAFAPPTFSQQQWKLVWADEFDREGHPDPQKWTYESGYVRNNEQQYYTTRRLENTRVQKGHLVLEGRKDNFPISSDPAARPSDAGKTAPYTSGSITTQGLFAWKYGRFEMRARLPKGQGIWPAFWTLGDKARWPYGGEIDIMEFIGKTPDTVYGTLHFQKPGDTKHTSSGGSHKGIHPSHGFHTYAIEWFPDRIDFFFDDIRFHTFEIDQAGKGDDNPFRRPHYIKLNLAIGGNWPGPVDDAILPQRYVIDYVRIYEAVSASPLPR